MVRLAQFHRNWVLNRLPGQGVVEFALFVPILALLLAGAVDLGRGFQAYIALTNAAREGVRQASELPNDPDAVCIRVQGELPPGMSVNCSDVTVTFPPLGSDGCPGGGAKVGCPVRVSVRYSLTTILGGILGVKTIDITPEVDMILFTQ